MRKLFLFYFFSLVFTTCLRAQTINDSIPEREVSRIIHVLASDSLEGRGNFEPGLLKAASFIGNEFEKIGLQTLPGFQNYFIPFQPFGKSNFTLDKLKWNGKKVSADHFYYFSKDPGDYNDKDISQFTVVRLDSFFTVNTIAQYQYLNTDLLIWTDKLRSDKNIFPKKFEFSGRGIKQNILIVYAVEEPRSMLLSATRSYSDIAYNVVGLLPGRSRANEVIILSAHYDHMGRSGGRIMNGANDDASGTTGVLALANYFAQRNDNERTLMFCAFAGEELGLKGSKDFVRYVDPDKIKAVINIEMIGVSQYGKKRVFVIGEGYSSLHTILKKNLDSCGLQIMKEPGLTRELFKRSDNYSFAVKGVPAHTIMSSDDNERCYHRPCDETDRIDVSNMTDIIRAIASATSTLISGAETPTRIKEF